MKTSLWIVVGLVIGIASWVPINMADSRDIPFGAAILSIIGTLVGGGIVLIAVVRWVRHGSGKG